MRKTEHSPLVCVHGGAGWRVVAQETSYNIRKLHQNKSYLLKQNYCSKTSIAFHILFSLKNLCGADLPALVFGLTASFFVSFKRSHSLSNLGITICAPTPALCHLYLAIFQIAWVLLKLIKVQFFLKLGTTWPSNLMNLLSRCPACKDVWGSMSRLLPTPTPPGRGVLGPLQLLLTAQLLPTTFLTPFTSSLRGSGHWGI